MKYAIGIDIGGTNTRVALISENHEIENRIQFPTNTEEPEETMEKIAQCIRDFGKETVGIGMSCPGALDLKNGVILQATNLGAKWHNYKMTEVLREKTGLPAYLENDANLACLAEATVGEGKDKEYVNFLTISTGVGAGQCIRGEIYQGSHGFGQEISNCVLWKGGPQHGGLLPGACEAICSGTAIVNRARQAGLEVDHAGNVNQLALDGNEKAMEIMEDAKDYLSTFIAMVYAFNDPDIVILGGSVAMKTPGFVEDVEARVKEKVYPVLVPYICVRRSTLNEDSGLIGAGALGFSKAA